MSINFDELAQNIIEKNTDIAEITKTLQTIREEIETQNETLTMTKEKVTQLETDNAKLKQTNLEYFFKLGHTDSKDNPFENNQVVEPKKYESLFDNKGNLL